MKSKMVVVVANEERLVDAGDVRIGDTIYVKENDEYHRIRLSLPMRARAVPEGGTYRWCDQLWRREGEHAVPLPDAERPYAEPIAHGAVEFNPDLMVEMVYTRRRSVIYGSRGAVVALPRRLISGGDEQPVSRERQPGEPVEDPGPDGTWFP